MDILSQYLSKVKKAVEAASNGCDPAEELLLLKPLESELTAYVAALMCRPDPVKAAEAHSRTTQQLRNMQPFTLTFSGGGFEQVIGWHVLAKHIRLAESSIRVMLSQGKGKFSIMRYNPLTNERDVLTVARVLLPGQPEKPKMGRPRTRPLTEAEATEHLRDTVKPTSNRKP